MSNFINFIGVDVSKYKIDIYISQTSEYKTISNKNLEREILNLKNELGDTVDKTLVIIDLTGGYEVLSRDIFHSNGFKSIILAEGLKVKNFARVKRSSRAKTDKIDAKILAEYGEIFHQDSDIKFYNPKEEDKILLEKYVSRITDLKELKQKEKNRLKAPNVPFAVLDSIKRNIEFLEEELKILKVKIKEIIDRNNEIKVAYDFLLDQKGIKTETAQLLISSLSELGKANRRQIASITGTAPVSRDSGTIKGYRSTNRGRPSIKKALFLVILSKIRYDKNLKEKYKEMQLRGKKKMVAIVALMRKLIVELNAKLRERLIDNNYHNNQVYDYF